MPDVTTFDAWAMRRLLTGHVLNGELEEVSRPLRRVAVHLAGLPRESRSVAFDGYLAGRDDAAKIIETLAGVDPTGPPPAAETTKRCANLADLRRLVADTRMPWPGW